MIFIYSDNGVSVEDLPKLESSLARVLPGCGVQRIDAAGIRQGDWPLNCDLLIVPGGRDIPYCEALYGKGIQAIKDYVNSGGRYLGLCAGAYFSCAHLMFDEGGELEVSGERQLKFFPGTAIGPIFGTGTYDYASRRGARACALRWKEEQEDFPSYYNGGCFFAGAETVAEVEVLATLAGEKEGLPVIIGCTVGKGRVLLSGLHPEFSGLELDATDPFLAQVIAILTKAEEQRVALLQRMFHWLGMFAANQADGAVPRFP